MPVLRHTLRSRRDLRCAAAGAHCHAAPAASARPPFMLTAEGAEGAEEVAEVAEVAADEAEAEAGTAEEAAEAVAGAARIS